MSDSQGPLYISEELNFFLPNCDSLTATYANSNLPVLKRRQRFSTSEVDLERNSIKSINPKVNKSSNTKPTTPRYLEKLQLTPSPRYKQMKDSVLKKVISIENYDPSNDGEIFNDEYTLQAMEIANILPEELFYSTYSQLSIEERRKQRQLISQKVQKVRQIRFYLIENDNKILRETDVDLITNKMGYSHLHGSTIKNLRMAYYHERRMSMKNSLLSPKVKATVISPQIDDNNSNRASSIYSEGNLCYKLPLSAYFDLKHIHNKKPKIIPNNPSEFYVKNIIF